MMKPRIVFMGTPEFAVASLDALIKNGHNIVGVITAPDKPAGRGMKMNESAVKKYALEHSLKIVQPEKLKNPGFLTQLKELKADLQVVVAFRMLPEAVWNMPPMGTINVHASLLPKYRGAAPINHAIINGEKETGVTTFRLTHEIDTGNILLRETILINDDDDAGTLHDKLKIAGAQLLIRTVSGLMDKSIKEQPQPNVETVHAPKLNTETSKINWSLPAEKIHNLIRGLSPYPAAFTLLKGKVFKIYKSVFDDVKPSAAPGEYETDNKTYLRFAATDGYIYAKHVQAEGKKRMEIDEFLRGFR
ncbi:MAG TPA: methionyl-tRNA formyltransferase [Flavitalea sp.]|nr:methionyl-tRNA formyltransferase [Flavitalea sp.]